MSGSSEPRRRKKDPDRDRSNPKSRDKDKDHEKDKERHKSSSKSSRSSRSKTSSSTSKDSDRDYEGVRERSSKERIRTSSSSHTPRSSNRMAVVPEMERRNSLGSPSGSRTSLSYPNFSKTHSKENIYSRIEAAERRKSPLTPEATDIGEETSSNDKERESTSHEAIPPPTRAPPSPPLTATTGADLRKTASVNSMRRKNSEALDKEMESSRRSVDSSTRLTSEPRFGASRSSLREGDGEGTELTSTTWDTSQPSTVRQRDSSSKLAPPKVRTSSPLTDRSAGNVASTSRMSSRQASEVTQSTDSDATSVPPDHQNGARPSASSPTNSEASPASVVDSSPRTPTQHSVLPSVLAAQKERPPTVEIITDTNSRATSVNPGCADSPLTPPPPPPPPALVDPPRVDYLLQNGGLSRPVPRSLIAAIEGGPIAAYSQYTSPRVSGAQTTDVRAFFKPLQKLLDDYSAVMDTNGSLAVATGYRSVARRLLDRLENVFARNISSEYCQCIMCLEKPPMGNQHDDDHVNWGEILELVSGRCELPNWPPLEVEGGTGLGITDLEDPCQRIDVDVPQEYRKHYAAQSRKTKVAVQSWLSNQQDAAPDEVDDETLTFAMLTRLEPAQRPLYYALLYGMKQLPSPRTQPTPSTETPATISKAALALQRLYRLYRPPRDQLVAMYLIRNQDMHDILATLSAVTKQEWEILVSGRFDGFLWSGAEDVHPLTSPGPGGGPSRGPSRGPSGDTSSVPGMPRRFASPVGQSPFTPFSPSQSPHPASRPASTRLGGGPAPVQVDEDTEIAVLAEIEREIYLGMEAMEDAFEHLHNSAEVVRRRLRERGAALSMVAQGRRGSMFGGIEVRTDTPASAALVDADLANLDDLRSEILPDDSASNVSHNRRRRGHRSRARHTPAPVEEESEVEVSLAERIKRKF